MSHANESNQTGAPQGPPDNHEVRLPPRDARGRFRLEFHAQDLVGTPIHALSIEEMRLARGAAALEAAQQEASRAGDVARRLELLELLDGVAFNREIVTERLEEELMALKARLALRDKLRRLALAEAELKARLRAAQRLCFAARQTGCPQAIDHADRWRDEVAHKLSDTRRERRHLEHAQLLNRGRGGAA